MIKIMSHMLAPKFNVLVKVLRGHYKVSHRVNWGAVLVCTAAIYAEPSIAKTAFPLGVFVGNPNVSSSASEANFEAAYSSFVTTMGVAPRLIVSFTDYTLPISSWANDAGWAASSNAKSPVTKTLIPILAFPMSSTAAGSASPDVQYQNFAAGKYDTVIQNVLLAWINQGFKRIYLRPGWEMNMAGPAYAGGNSQIQSDWILAFQRIYRVAKRTAVTSGAKIAIVWNPGITNYASVNATEVLYPTDKFVDVVGADVYADIYPYSDGGNPAEYHDWDTGQEDSSIAEFISDPVNRLHYWSYPAATKWANDCSGGHALSLNTLLKFALLHHKPIAISETGAGGTGTDASDDAAFPQWLFQQLSATISAGGRVAYVDIWDSNAGGSYEFSKASDNKPLEAAAWKQYFGSSLK